MSTVVSIVVCIAIAYKQCWLMTFLILILFVVVRYGNFEVRASAIIESLARDECTDAMAFMEEAVVNIEVVRAVGKEGYFLDCSVDIMKQEGRGKLYKYGVTSVIFGCSKLYQYLIWNAMFVFGGFLLPKRLCGVRGVVHSSMMLLLATFMLNSMPAFTTDATQSTPRSHTDGGTD